MAQPHSFFGEGWKEIGVDLPASDEDATVGAEAFEVGYLKSMSPEQRAIRLDVLNRRKGGEGAALAYALLLAKLDEWGE